MGETAVGLALLVHYICGMYLYVRRKDEVR